MNDNLPTDFASPGRNSYEELSTQLQAIINDPLVKIILQAVNGYALILNSNRQILAGNRELLDTLGLQENDVLGLRPGEMMQCLHSKTAPAGCGTTIHCRSCGAVLSILAAQQTGEPSENECRLLINDEGETRCIDFQVKTTPYVSGENQILIFVLQDISSLKRKEVLERVFLHDLNNILGALSGFTSLLDKQDKSKAAKQIVKIVDYLKEEVNAQHLLLKAEKGELLVNLRQVSTTAIANKLQAIFELHQSREERDIFWSPDPDLTLTTDPVLLEKILVNMLKNGLEATPPGGQVQYFCEEVNGRLRFCVHNQGEIPPEVALNIFHRSFTTKPGSGRGIGTYSMKLFGENYLKGQVGFESSAEGGTIFYIELPL